MNESVSLTDRLLVRLSVSQLVIHSGSKLVSKLVS